MVAPTIVSKGRLAVNSLRKAEDAALAGSDGGGENGGFYTGSGKNNSNTKTKAKGKLRTKIAGILIVAMLGGGGLFLSSTNSMLGPALEALVTEQTDTQYASSNQRSVRLMRYAVQGQEVIKTNTWTGAKKYGHMSKNFKTKLANNGITIDGTGKNAKLVFTQNITDNDGVTKQVSKTIAADDFTKTINSDADFREAFQTARRGRVATFFDNIATKVLAKLGNMRNVWRNFISSSDSEVNEKAFRETMGTKSNGGSVSANSVYKQAEKSLDAEGKEYTEVVTKNESVDIDNNTKVNTDAEATVKAKNMLSSVGSKVVGVGNFACAIPRVISTISLMIAAQEIYQSINFFMPMMESVSKMKNGDGDSSAINETLNFLSTPATTETTKFGKITITENEDTSGKEETVKQTGSPLEANGMQMILAGAALTAGTTELFSLERANRFAWSTTTSTEQTCMVNDAAMAVVSIGVTIASLGTATIATELFGFATSAAIGGALQLALGFMVPTIAKVFFTNAFESATGIPAGEMFARGGSAANTRLGRNGSGQSLSSEQAAIAYNKVNQEVIAMDAEIDRKNLSPFDITNKNTFLGSIAYSLLPITTNSNITNISSLLSVTGKSLGSIINTSVSADGKDTSYMTKFGNCKSLASIGAVGDPYCNPVPSTDVSTINMDPNDETYQEVINDAMENCDENGDKCTIKKSSDLAKYVTYCANRDSPFGSVDQNILSNLQTSSGLGSWRGIVGAAPLVGDIADLMDVANNAENMPWATGERCGNTTNNAEFWGTKGKYYQRYIEDMRIIEQYGAFDGSTNPIMAYMDEYEAEHPTDNTYIGYLSRISGVLPENVETALAFMDYYQYVEDYEPETRIAMTDHPSITNTSDDVIAKAESEKGRFTDNSHSIIGQFVAIIRPAITYADIRNRSFAV